MTSQMKTRTVSELMTENMGTDLLAKMLADSGITVVYRAVQTAYADLENKVVVLPFWDISKVCGIMLRSHEVAHLLYTPMSDFHAVVDLKHPLVKGVDEKHRHIIKRYVNILEDVRIERLIALRYAGLIRILSMGHYELYQAGFYQAPGDTKLLDPKEVTSITDRVMIRARLGNNVGMTYTRKDDKWYNLAIKAETFDDVVELAVRIYMKEKAEKSIATFEEMLKQIAQNSTSLRQKIMSDKGEKSDSQDGGDPTVESIEGEGDGEPSDGQGSNSQKGKEKEGKSDKKDSEKKEKTGKSSNSGSNTPEGGEASDESSDGESLSDRFDKACENAAAKPGEGVGSLGISKITNPHSYFPNGNNKALSAKIFF